MALFQSKYDTLVFQYQRLVSDVAHTSRGHYQQLDDKIRAAGVAIIEHEKESGIKNAREDLALERTIAAQVASLEKVLHKYSGLTEAEENLVAAVVNGSISVEELEDRANRLETFDKILKVTREGLKRLQEWSDKIAARKSKLPKAALTDARKADPLSREERTAYEEIYESDRVNRITREQFAKITKPEPAVA